MEFKRWALSAAGLLSAGALANCSGIFDGARDGGNAQAEQAGPGADSGK